MTARKGGMPTTAEKCVHTHANINTYTQVVWWGVWGSLGCVWGSHRLVVGGRSGLLVAGAVVVGPM